MSYGLILSGGGSRAAFGLGVAKYFEEIGIEFKAYSGTSGGAIAASLLASGISAEQSLETIKNIDFKKLVRFNYFRGSIFKIEEDELKGILPYKNFEELPKPLYINAIDFNSGEIKYFNSGDILSSILSACALYPIFKPYYKDGTYYIDGGFSNNLPYEPLKDIVDTTIAVNVNPVRKIDFNNLSFFKKLKRVLMLLFYGNIAPRSNQVDIFIESSEIGRYNILDTSCLDRCFELGYNHVKNLELDKKLRS